MYAFIKLDGIELDSVDELLEAIACPQSDELIDLILDLAVEGQDAVLDPIGLIDELAHIAAHVRFAARTYIDPGEGGGELLPPGLEGACP